MTLNKENRDALLDELLEAFDNALDAERKRVNRQISLLEKLAEGRDLGGVEANVLNSLGEHAQGDLDNFITG